MVPFIALSCVNLLLLSVHVFLFLKRSKLPKNRSYSSPDLSEFLHDLTRGPAVVSIHRIDPESILLRSTRGR